MLEISDDVQFGEIGCKGTRAFKGGRKRQAGLLIVLPFALMMYRAIALKASRYSRHHVPSLGELKDGRGTGDAGRWQESRVDSSAETWRKVAGT